MYANSKNLLPLAELMLDELSPLLEEKDGEKTAITLCYSQVEACPLPTQKVLEKKAPTYFSFMESLHEAGCKSLFPDLPDYHSQCLQTVAGLTVPKISQSVPHLSPYDQGAIHATKKTAHATKSKMNWLKVSHCYPLTSIMIQLNLTR
jgi:hypothetical protein